MFRTTVTRAAGSRLQERTRSTILRPVSRVCSICGRKPSFGNNRSYSMVATKRRFDPNLQRIRIIRDGVAVRTYVCTRCIKGGKIQRAL